MRNIIRQYKLYKLGIPTDIAMSEFFEFFETKIFTLHKFEPTQFPKWVFFLDSEGSNVLQFGKEKKLLYMRNSKTRDVFNHHLCSWEFIQKMLNYNYGLYIEEIRYRSEDWDWVDIEMKYKDMNS